MLYQIVYLLQHSINVIIIFLNVYLCNKLISSSSVQLSSDSLSSSTSSSNFPPGSTSVTCLPNTETRLSSLTSSDTILTFFSAFSNATAFLKPFLFFFYPSLNSFCKQILNICNFPILKAVFIINSFNLSGELSDMLA